MSTLFSLPAGNTPGDTGAGSSNSATPQRQGTPSQGQAQPENNPRARGHSPAMDARGQQAPPSEQKIKIGEAEYTAADLEGAIAERAERQSQRANLPAGPDQYRVELPADFQAPEGVRFEFDKTDPALARAREVAHKRGIPQDVFSEMLGVYASTRMGEAIQQSKLRDVNMKQLGAAGPQRVEAVATWLQARAGADGKTMANFLRQFPSAPIVKATENLMRVFSNQGGADFSQQHRAGEEDRSGRIAGYENMSFTQRRATQMAERMRNDPSYGRRGGPSER
jgi:hypothetical protein